MKLALPIAAVLLLAPAATFAQSDDAPAATNIHAHYTLDTPIKDLVADPAAKAVLDKDLPGMSSDDNLPKFADKSLRQLQPMSGGQLTDDLLKKTGEDLAATGSDAAGADAGATGDTTPDAAPAPTDNPPADDAPTQSTDTGR